MLIGTEPAPPRPANRRRPADPDPVPAAPKRAGAAAHAGQRAPRFRWPYWPPLPGTLPRAAMGQGGFCSAVAGLIFSYALAPLVNHLEKLRLPRALGRRGDSGPAGSDRRNRCRAGRPGRPDSSIASRRGAEVRQEKVQKAATELKSGQGKWWRTERARAVTGLQIERPQFNINDYLLTSTPGMLAALGQATVVVFLTFFLLASGNSFRRKLVKLAGPICTKKDHGSGSGRDRPADPALPADPGADQRHRRRRHRPGRLDAGRRPGRRLTCRHWCSLG